MVTRVPTRMITTTGVQAGSYTAADITVNEAGQITSASSGTGGGGATVTILSVIVTSDTYANLDDTAVDISGGYIKIIGTGFASGCTVLVNNIPATSTTFIGPTEVRAQLPATAAGTYVLYVVNANGSVAIRVNGITFSATPSWINSSDLSSHPLNEAISIQLSATSATTYALQSGSSLPAGLTLSSSGLLSGTVTGLENDTSYSFAVIATDAELQDSPRTFTITIVVQVQVSRSLRFNATDTTYLSRTPATTTNRTTWTVSAWVKRSALGATQNIIRASDGATNDTLLRFESSDSIGVYTNGATNLNLITTAKYRDPSAWYHIVLAVDTTQSTPSNRALLYVNGTQVTAFTTETYVTQNTNTQFNSTSFAMNIGRYSGGGGSEYLSAYMAEFNFIDGQQLTPTAFALTNTTTGQYGPRKYMGSYGTNGFYLPFTDNSSVLNLGRNYEPLTADPLWPQTVLLLNGTGTNNANNNTFTDSSTNAFAITRSGNTTQGTFSPFSQTGWGNYFDGSGGDLTVPVSLINIGTNDFCVEAWIYTTGSAQNQEILGATIDASNTTTIFLFEVQSNGLLRGRVGGSSQNSLSTTVVSPNEWHHVALSRESGTLRLFLNGVEEAETIVSSTNMTGFTQARVGSLSSSTAAGPRYFNGYISNFRFSDSAIYTAAFTPPTAPFVDASGTELLTCQSNRFVDNSSNNFTITCNGDVRVTPFSPFPTLTAYSPSVNGGSGYFDGSGDYLTVASNAAFAVGTGQFTLECWLYFNTVTNIGEFLWTDASGTTSGRLVLYYSGGNLQVVASGGAGGTSASWTPVAGQWYHIAASRDGSNNQRLFVNGELLATATSTNNYTQNGFGVVRSASLNGYITDVRLVNGTAVYTSAFTPPTAPLTAITNTSLLLNFTNAGIYDATSKNDLETVGDAKISTAQSKWGGGSISFDGTGSPPDYLPVITPVSDFYAFGTGDFTFELWLYTTTVSPAYQAVWDARTADPSLGSHFVLNSGKPTWWLNGASRIQGASALSINTWYHIAVARSGTSTKMFVDGTQVGSTYTDSNAYISRTVPRIGASFDATPINPFYGYIQDLRITRAARYTGNFTPPTAQFAYNQSDINYKQWVPVNFSVTAGAGNDSLLDTPTNWGVDTGLGGEVRGNYCTWNQLDKDTNATISNGGLDLTAYNAGTYATWPLYSGKWYYEITLIDPYNGTFGSYWGAHGLTGGPRATASATTATTTAIYCNTSNDQDVPGIYVLGTRTIVYRTFANNDVLGFAIDMDARTMTITRNGVAVATNVTIASSTPMYIWSNMNGASGDPGSVTANFGQRPFAYAAPSGFKSLNTHNLPALAVVKSNTAFDTVLYTGNGSTQTVSGLNFSPDLVWIKDRSSSVVGHRLYDTIRGATKEIYTHATNAETIDAAGLTAFTTNGFTTGNSAGTNTNGNNLVAWAWDAGTTTVTSTAGTISAQVRANPTTGFSIVTYTGTGANATVGHGLSTAPSMIIVKIRSSSAENWLVYHASLSTPSTAFLYLNSTTAASTLTTYWNGGPTSSVFGLGAYSGINNSTSTYVAYCWAPIPGYSAFGSYTGNGSADGPFVYTGFRPRFILLKSSTVAATNWQINDTARDTYNVANKRLAASAADAEATNFDFGDILSNGFKIRQTDQTWNSNGQTYIYAAFAEQPFKYSRAR